ncbi:MAG: SDR family oxidoreductase [Arcanobacterium sp.]|nr:SDR family oxidoreductase [Arcanobacterium sp.]
MVIPAAQKILLTGASRGIGATIARVLAKPGRALYLAARTREALYGTARACTERGATVQTFAVDLADVESVQGFASRIRDEFGGVDLLVNNAGVLGPEALPWEADLDAWWETQLVNLRAPFILQKVLVPGMIARGGGRIIDLSSGAAVRDDDLCSSYFVSKTALLRLAGSLHLAGKEHGLKVFPVAPGVVRTDMTSGMQMHIGREIWNEPTEVAELIAAIADGELDGIAGAQIRAGSDKLADLKELSEKQIADDDSRKLRLSDW